MMPSMTCLTKIIAREETSDPVQQHTHVLDVLLCVQCTKSLARTINKWQKKKNDRRKNALTTTGAAGLW